MKKKNIEAGKGAMDLIITLALICVGVMIIYVMFSGKKNDARLSKSLEGLNAINKMISLNYRVKYDKYPDKFEDLFKIKGEIQETDENGKLVTKKVSFKNDMPYEYVSSEKGSKRYTTVENLKKLDGRGGWAYVVELKRVVINWDQKLDPDKWPVENFPETKGKTYPPKWGIN